MPQIRPTKFTDFNDQPLNNAYVYVYKVGESYLDSAALLTLTDADTGSAISNPFRTNEYGYPINSNSQTVNPTFAEVQWAVRVESAQNVEVKTFPKMIADNFNEDTEQSSVVDATFADLPDAKNANLTAYDTVYIQNETAGWEGTLAGPTTGFYAHKDGTTGAPGTGDSSQFFDSAGNGFTRDDLQRVDEAQFDQNTADIAALSPFDALFSGGTLLAGMPSITIDGDTDDGVYQIFAQIRSKDLLSANPAGAAFTLSKTKGTAIPDLSAFTSQQYGSDRNINTSHEGIGWLNTTSDSLSITNSSNSTYAFIKLTGTIIVRVGDDITLTGSVSGANPEGVGTISAVRIGDAPPL